MASRPSTELRLIFLGFIILCGLGVLVSKLWWEQVARGDTWRRKIAGRSEVTVRIPSVRGEIRDRNGVTLVANRASYEVDFYLPDMVQGYRREMGFTPKVEYLNTVKQMKTKQKEADIVKIVNESVIPRLNELDLAKDYNSEHLQKHYRNDTLVPFTYEQEVDFKTIAKFSEHNVGLPGVDISVKPVRQYVYGALAAHLLGYVGAPLDVNLLPDISSYTFYQPDVDGKSQIEASMDKYLRGAPGKRVLRKSVKGIIESEDRVEPPKPGANVYLTLDARIQYITEQALRHPQLGRAAAVVVDPNNGDILAMASVPSFDPNVFIPSVSPTEWKKLNTDPALPLISRAVSAFPPGSTFKIVTALGGLSKKGAHMETSKFNCPGGIQYGDHYFKCWIADKHGSHGTIGLSDALRVSCDCFFYQYGNAAGMEYVDQIGKVLGIGEHYDIGLQDEKDGVMPGPQWMKTKYPELKWSNAYTANAAIGQGYVLASPLQMAMAYATVANGGVVYEPRLIKKVLTPDGKPVLDENGQEVAPEAPKIRGDLRTEVTKEQIDVVRHGLWQVVNDAGGTGAKARVKGIVVAGKTGSAQATDRGKDDMIAWFCCFAPFDKPRYAICVMVQGGHHGGGVAGPIAQYILEHTVAMEQGNYNVELTKLEPARGKDPFAKIEALTDYKDANNVQVTPEAEEGADTHAASSSKVQMGGGNAHPDIGAEADAGGRVQGRGNRPATPANSSAPPKQNFFQKFFGIKPSAPNPPRPQPRGTH
ncbi:penicillin-binding protein 2 [Chthoniobacter flavus Ellin428]|uniref:Beta-lactamase n=1 Tax=Chthoniobacter flavus Ellin428 TaxID=497964 RepID=B4D4U3_9BACT|nr:penicillin-binding protein 2 [Chthoniobacter flavus]EDY18546.1 penicillin-binding protein 2 [Chthoniobacter flavus Ellin428]TCO90999.1 peptidoglycan glycosyltransferase [Chthoniobacter flavus]